MKSFRSFLIFFILFSFATSSFAWTNRLEITSRSAIASANCLWTPQGAAIRLLQDDVPPVEIRLLPGSVKINYDPRLNKETLETISEKLHSFEFTPPATNLFWLTFKRASRGWRFYIDDQPVLLLPELGTNTVTLCHTEAMMPPEEERDEYVQRLGTFRVDDSFMVEEGVKLSDNWERLAGDWRLHAVTGTTITVNEKKPLKTQPTVQRSPNFYSLEGSGAPAITLTGESFHDSYTVRASVQHNDGVNGIVFLVGDDKYGYGFTTRTNPDSEQLILELWRGKITEPHTYEIISAVQTALQPGQWLLLEARIFDDRIVCMADNIEIMREHLQLPPSGRYGLYAMTSQGTRFDDFSAASHGDYPFNNDTDMQLYTLRSQGTFYTRVRGRLFERARKLFSTDKNELNGPCSFESPGADQIRERIIGNTDDPPHLFSVVFMPVNNKSFSCGVYAGWQSVENPGYRFTCHTSDGIRHFKLEKISTSPDAPPLEASIDLPLTSTDRRIRLTIDALRPNELRALADDKLVLLLRPSEPITGASGIFIESQQTVRHNLPLYTTRAPIYSDRFEKNLQYVNDPYMRHWASPEGQWVQNKSVAQNDSENTVWLRGDIFGRVRLRLPIADPSTVLLAYDMASSNAACRVEIDSSYIKGYVPGDATQSVWSVQTADIPTTPLEGHGNIKLFTIGMEDHVFWIGDDYRLFAQAPLIQIPAGRRILAKGFGNNQLRQTLVRRENVFDTLFNESLFNWNINGGSWEVINRFQCDPTWSHMNGESSDSLAALWSRYNFKGDFCVELFAGMRMGWYERAGDLNITVMSSNESTGNGYSLTTTGWDPDHSQRYTRLWRNGEVVAVSTNYLVPRIRNQNTRYTENEPLIASGRDIHGAWYGIRLSRTGAKLSYLFDNTRVFEWEDPDPVQSGSLGIWTFHNSMMVARIRIAAESIEPRSFNFTPIKMAKAEKSVEISAEETKIKVGRWPAQPLDVNYWEADDPASRPMIRFDGRDGQRVMRVTAQQCAGTFLARANLPFISSDELLGWHFEIARSPDALINFEFASGNGENDHKFKDGKFWSFVLSGSNEIRGIRKSVGQQFCQPSTSAEAPIWTSVDVWLPSAIFADKEKVMVEGFGNLQPSDVQQGLLGNPPGAWYAIRNFQPIHRGRPIISSNSENLKTETETVQAKIAASPSGVINRFRLPQTLDKCQPTIFWSVPQETTFGLNARYDETLDDVIRIASTNPWNATVLPPKQIKLNDQSVQFADSGDDILVFIPRPRPDYGKSVIISVELTNGRTFKQAVSLSTSKPKNHPPALLAIEMPEGGLTSFEARPPVEPYANLPATVSIRMDDPEVGSYLEIYNGGKAQRLNTRLLPKFDPIVTPLLQIRYRGDPMANVTFSTGNSSMAMKFNEPGWGNPAAISNYVAKLDNNWHTWLGILPSNISDTYDLRDMLNVKASTLTIGSKGNPDQTGLYSSLSINYIACGPAAGPLRPLAFRPNYSDPDGVASVEYALIPGVVPWEYRTADEQLKVSWLKIENMTVITPDCSTLPEGIHHLVVRASDTLGALSKVADIPFMLDRTPPTVSATMRPFNRYNDFVNGNDQMVIDFTSGFAMPVLRDMRILCDDKAIAFNNVDGLVKYSPNESLSFIFEWAKPLFRELKNAKDGQTLTLELTNLSDMAGNRMADTKIPIKINYAADKRPPNVVSVNGSTNILNWFTCMSDNQSDGYLSPDLVSQTRDKQDNDFVFYNYTFLKDQKGKPSFQIYIPNNTWQPEKFPWLALSVRFIGSYPNKPNLTARLFTSNVPPHVRRQRRNNSGIELDFTDKQANGKYIHGITEWKAGEWQDILIDVRSFMRDKAKNSSAPMITAAYIYFELEGDQALQVRATAIMGPWAANDTLKFRAYDESGVRGIVWQNGTRSDDLVIKPASIKLPSDDNLWLRAQIEDNPGNRSFTYFIPVPPQN